MIGTACYNLKEFYSLPDKRTASSGFLNCVGYVGVFTLMSISEVCIRDIYELYIMCKNTVKDFTRCHLQLQEYSMECNLCGHGEATVSILPDDPREKELF